MKVALFYIIIKGYSKKVNWNIPFTIICYIG